MNKEMIAEIVEKYENEYDEKTKKQTLEFAKNLRDENKKRMSHGFNFSKAYIEPYELYRELVEKLEKISC